MIAGLVFNQATNKLDAWKQQRVQMETSGLSYLKYADTTYQWFNRNSNAKHASNCSMARNFKELQPEVPSGNPLLYFNIKR